MRILRPLTLFASLLSAGAWAQDVTAEALRSHVRFLASDSLKGRNTPSPELDIAAEYIAAQFERLGAEPAFSGSFFQEADFTNRRSGATGKAKNVGAMIPGTDPSLTGVIVVSAHYDHLGENPDREGDDKIFNGANDDASGVAGIIELAGYLKAAKPKRTIMLVAFYGEEKGLVGARHFVQNPPVPLKQIIANVNLEQIGRTDDLEGPRVGEANFTGFDYSDIPGIFVEANKGTYGFVKHEKNSDPFFFAADNAAFAGAGIPAHTISTCYMFPDYHQVGDHWEKLDYANFAKTTLAIGKGLKSLADREKAPQWNREISQTQRFADAYDKLMSGG